MSSARTLIINADDLGCNAQRTHGIFQCMEFGVVTNATIWPNVSDSEAAARRARERGFPVGLHLNLVEEYPLNKPDQIATLLGPGGAFMERSKLWQALDDGIVHPDHLEREVRSQIEWIFDHGLTPTHIAGNYDAHVHPQIVHAMIPTMERYGVRYVRIPNEAPLPPFGYEVSDNVLKETAMIGEKSEAVRGMFAAHGIVSTDHFRGLTLLGNASLKNLRHVISKLPEGVTELMVHPGSACVYGTPFDLDPQRQTELRMLLDETIPALIAEKKIRL